jgi:hypothetical protein
MPNDNTAIQDPYAAYGGKTIVPEVAASDPYAAYGGATIASSEAPKAPTTAEQIRYSVPGQGIQEFTKGSTDEQQFLQRFPTATALPNTYKRKLQTGETIDTEAPQVRTARETADARSTLGKTAKTMAVVGGAIAAPYLLPELAAGSGLLATGGHLLAEAGLAGGGAAVGNEVGRVATGESLLSKEAAQEAGTEAAKYGFGQLAGGITGEVLGHIAKAVRSITAPSVDVYKAGTDLVETITGGEAATEKTVVNNTMAKLQEAHQKMSDEYGAALDAISKAAKDLPIYINKSPLQEIAQELMNGPAGVPEKVGQAMSKMTPGSEQIRPLIESLSGAEGQLQIFSWDEMVKTREFINGEWRGLSYKNPIKWDLQRLLYGIDNTLGQVAKDADIPHLSENFEAIRKVYAQKTAMFSENAIKTLTYKSPDSVADILIGQSGQKVKNIETLRNLIGEDAMPEVEGNILAKLLHKASDNGVTNINKFRKSFEGLGPDLQQAIWGDNLPQIKSFITDATKDTKDGEISRKLLSYIAHGRLGGYMSVKLMFDIARGNTSPKTMLDDLGLIAGSLVAGKYGPEIIAKHGARVADILQKGSEFMSNPATTALPIGAVSQALAEPTEEAAPEQTTPEQRIFKVGDTIYQNGRPFTVKSIDANGKVTGAE